MKRLLIYLVLALVVGGAVGTSMSRDPGYVLVTYAGMSFETSLWFAVVALIVGYGLLRVIVRVTGGLVRGGAGIQAWQQNRRVRNARERTVRGLLLAGEGDWTGARKTLASVAAQADTPLVNYVVAAHAANELGDASERDALLQKAEQSTPGATVAVALARADLQIAAQQYDGAIATLLNVKDSAAAQVRVLRMLVNCYEQRRDWAALLALAPDLERRRALSTDALRTGLRRWWCGFFAARTGAADEVTERLLVQWQNTGKDLRGDPELIVAEAEAWLRSGDAGAAEATLRKGLGEAWNDQLVERYGRLRSPQVDRQLAAAEGWLKGHPNDPVLLLALGRVALMNSDSGKAREYFEASLKLQRSAAAYGELGRLCAASGDTGRGAELLAQALEMGGGLLESPREPLATSAAARS
jgi:HemY protein